LGQNSNLFGVVFILLMVKLGARWKFENHELIDDASFRVE